MIHRPSKIAWSVLAITISLVLASSSPADGHVAKDRSWYWYVGTRDINNERKQLDPIDILWAPGSTYSPMNENNLQNEVESQWRRRPSKGQMNHGQVCLGQSRGARVFGDGRQHVIFKSNNGSGRRKVATWFQESTSNRCFSQYHMRFWNDSAHRDVTSDHGGEGQWGISGVHRDIATCRKKYAGEEFGGCHKINGHWSSYRNYAINRAMRSMCGRARWRQYPGGDRRFQGKRFDGYIGIVKGQSSSCPRGLY